MNKKIKFKVRKNKNEEDITESKKRFSEFIKAAGGATAISKKTGIAIGTIKGAHGSKGLMISPVLAHRLCEFFKDSIDKKFTREHLRFDISSEEWERLDRLIRA